MDRIRMGLASGRTWYLTWSSWLHSTGSDHDDGQVGWRPGTVGRSSSAAAEADTGRRTTQDHPDVPADTGADPALAQAQGAHATAAGAAPAAATAPAAARPAATETAAAAGYGERGVLIECY